VTINRPTAPTFTVVIVATLSDGEVVAHRVTYSGCSHSAVHTVIRHRMVRRVRVR
jgi:hypothetical protein